MAYLHEILQEKEESHILPFLWMKGESNEVIKEELDKIEACGIREVCLESRPHPDFCGDGWWENLDFIIPEAEKRGMKIWILDDDKFPTGHANGGFKRQPEKKKVYLAERHMDICGPCRNHAVLMENFLYPDGKLLAVLAVPKPDGETLAISGEGIIDLTEQCENGFVYFSLPEGRYRLFILFTTQFGGGREDYMNLIDHESVRVLIDEVYEKHYERYGKYFGSVIAGFFSDEPELGNVKGYPFDDTLGKKDQRLPWSIELEEALKKRWGDKFVFHMPALWYDSGEQTSAIRSDYMEEMTTLVRECFSSQLGEWCEAHHVEYIGHIIEDDNAHTRMACSIGHYFREMEGQHMAGIDVVHHQIVPGFTEPVHQWIAGDRDGEFFHYGLAKLAASAAHIQKNKKHRALCEIFGNYGWAEGNSFMKWLTDHMLVRGINMFTPHAFSMTYPDRDCPPHFYARGNNPGFEVFQELMKYMNRAAAFLSDGVHISDAAILYHAEAEWAGGEFMYYQKPGRRLMECQMDYDVLPVDVLDAKQVKFKEGRFFIGEEGYPCLILPYAQYLSRKAAEFVEEAEKNGVKLFQIDAYPECDTERKPLPQNWNDAVELLSLETVAEKVKEIRKSHADFEVCTENKNLRAFFIRKEEAFYGMLFNESVCHNAEVTVKLKNPAYQAVTFYDPWKNTSGKCMLCKQELTMQLEPGQAVFLYLKPGETSEKQQPKLLKKLCPEIVWKVSKKGVAETEYELFAEIQSADEMPNLNGKGYLPGFTGCYRYEGELFVEKEEGKTYLLHLLEAADCVKIFVNQIDCGCAAGFPSRTDITEALKNGGNEIRIEVMTTLVWERKDGASTHLQIPASGITKAPEIEIYQ